MNFQLEKFFKKNYSLIQHFLTLFICLCFTASLLVHFDFDDVLDSYDISDSAGEGYINDVHSCFDSYLLNDGFLNYYRVISCRVTSIDFGRFDEKNDLLLKEFIDQRGLK